MSDVVPGLVSTIIPVFNRPEMLRRAVESVLAQTWRPIEVIISDDGSDDPARAAGEALEAAHPGVVRYFWNPNRGAGMAREFGRNVAHGEFIQYLDSDDTLHSNKFELQVGALRATPDAGAAYGAVRLFPEGGVPGTEAHKWTGRKLDSLFPGLLVDRWWTTHAPLWRRSVCDQIGPWTNLRYSQDWEYDARAGALGVRLVHVPGFVADQHHHGELRQTGSGRWLAPDEQVHFFGLMLAHARKAGVPANAPEMRHFIRWVFASARRCAIAGDVLEAKQLLALVGEAAGGHPMDLLAYEGLSHLVGWGRAARWLETLASLARRGHGPRTMKQSWMGPSPP